MDLQTQALQAALQAGESILDIYNDKQQDFGVEHKADHSPLTIADKNSHQIISEALKQSPYPILSEEGHIPPYEERRKWSTFWLIDPLDGTKEFIKKNGEFTVNIALIQDGVPVFGVIYAPVLQNLYWGDKASGAWKIEQISKVSELATAIKERALKLPLGKKQDLFTVVGSRSHSNEATENYIAMLKEKHGNINFLSKGSSLKICLVAEGSADIYPRFGPTMEWDTAAGHAIALAAGKNIALTDHRSPLSYNKKDLLNPYFIVA